MEDLEDLARSAADVDRLVGDSSRGVGSGSGSGAGVVRFSRSSRRSPAPPLTAEDAAPAAALSTLTPSPSFRLDSSGLGGAPATPRVWLRTFGCAHNVADSETMAGVLKEAGFEVKVGGGAGEENDGGNSSSSSKASASASADAWVVNSCTVKGPRSRSWSRRPKRRENPLLLRGACRRGSRGRSRSSRLRSWA